MDRILIAPSTDPAKTEKDLVEYIHNIQAYADFLHCDVMDGLFVSRKTISYDTIALIKQNCLLPLDVHLMVENPMPVLGKYAESGANIITVHYESFESGAEFFNAIKHIKKLGCLAGVSVKPQTKIQEIYDVLEIVDLVLVMSVEPGKSGQHFMSETLTKISELNDIRVRNGYKFLIEVDGGINNENCSQIINSGADVLVSGNYVYSADDKKVAIESLRV